jgi:hypothetical protein
MPIPIGYASFRARGVVDEETSRFIAIRKVKLERLYLLDKQAAAAGEFNVPPQVEMERRSLRDELGMIDAAIAAPARSEVGDELGPAGRFLVYHQQNREIKQSIAALAVELQTFVTESQEWRVMHRQWLIIISIIVVLILVAIVGYVAYLAGQGKL